MLEVEEQLPWNYAGAQSAALRQLTAGIVATSTTDELLNFLTHSIRDWLGFDRVVAYRFDESYNGLIVAESRSPEVPSLLGVHFWARDVPEELRENQRLELVRNFHDAAAAEVGFRGELPAPAHPFVRDHLACRAPHPLSRTFLQDFGLATMLSVALLVDGRLWGSIYAHHRTPRPLDLQMRTTLEVLARCAGQTIGYQRATASGRQFSESSNLRSRLQDAVLSASSITEGLTQGQITLLDFVADTTGAALCVDGKLTTVGTVPEEDWIHALRHWVEKRTDAGQSYGTDNLTGVYPPARGQNPQLAGLYYIALDSRGSSWVMWFRPERVQTITYGSAPDEDAGRFGQRFRNHQGTLTGYSHPWLPYEERAIQDFQNFIRDVVVQRYTELRQINERLRTAYEEMESFSYSVSHDLRAPLRGIDGFSEIFMEEYGQTLPEDGRELIVSIQENAARMNAFITDILELSRVGRAELFINPVPVAPAVHRVLKDLAADGTDTDCVTVAADLPTVYADERYLRTVLTNLISNAIKYSARGAAPRVWVGSESRPDTEQPVLFVEDNGIGIAPEHHKRVFDMFVRLVAPGDYEGTGVGLAIVARIVNRHRGEIRIEEGRDGGTKFAFWLDPKPESTTR